MVSRLKLVTLLGAILAAAASAWQIDEYQVKAAFLYNFARFVEWPASAFEKPDDPVRICILGENPFGSALEQAISGKVVEGRRFIVRQVSNNEPVGRCQVLFVNSSERKRFRSLAAGLKGRGILTVGESSGFASDGGIINFKLEAGRVRFEINPDAAEQERLRISSKLLSLAQIVRMRGQGDGSH